MYEANTLHKIKDDIQDYGPRQKEDQPVGPPDGLDQSEPLDQGNDIQSTYWSHNVAVEIPQRLKELGNIWKELKCMSKNHSNKLKEPIAYQQFLRKIEEEEEWTKVRRQLLNHPGMTWETTKNP